MRGLRNWKPKISRKEMTAESLRKFLDYDPKTGLFTWKQRPAGSRHKNGPITINLGGWSCSAHRLAWLWMTGNWPKNLVDHKNGNNSDNRWENLREADWSQNAMNRKRRSDNKTGYKGVIWYPRNKQWGAKIYIKGPGGKPKVTWLGLFLTAEEAHAAYCKAASELHGEFANPG